MVDICPRCMQPLPHEKENEIESDLKSLLIALEEGMLVGLWGTVGYVTTDDIDKRKNVELHAAHVGALLRLLKLMESIKDIEIYDDLGTGDEDSQLGEDSEDDE